MNAWQAASPVAETGPWSLGTLIAMPISIICAALLLGIGAAGVRHRRKHPGDELDGFLVIVFLGFGTLTALGTLGGMWPYDSEFHQWRDVEGTVQEVDSRMVRDGEGMSERYVFVIGGQPFGVDDTRASLVNEGDTVTLRCKREWEYAAESGWACRWSGVEK